MNAGSAVGISKGGSWWDFRTADVIAQRCYTSREMDGNEREDESCAALRGKWKGKGKENVEAVRLHHGVERDSREESLVNFPRINGQKCYPICRSTHLQKEAFYVRNEQHHLTTMA